MPTHMNLRYAEIAEIWPHVIELQELAAQYGIRDIFQDAGGKMLQLAIAVGLDLNPGRQGADAFDRRGNAYEIKTTDLTTSANGFSTARDLNHATIARYRTRRWVFATYEGITLHEAYMVLPDDMEPVYSRWLSMLRSRDRINNPKIEVDYVRSVGTALYLKDVPPPWAIPIHNRVILSDTDKADGET